MPRRVSLAAIRMDAAPAPTESRLERAEKRVAQAAAQGAQIAVLPEVFNTGYEYHDRNYSLAEPMDGPTVSWLKSAARKYNLYLAGSLLLREPAAIYNAMLLVAPDGKTWRYDKTYPWCWERAYFRPRKHPIAPAETELGKIGMLVCWDAAHPSLWAAYAGKVDLMLVSSCPPLAHQMTFRFPDGNSVQPADLGPVIHAIYRNGGKVFNGFFLEQSAWLGVPAVNTTGAGQFRSLWPRPRLTFSVLLAARPDLWKYIPQAEQITGEAGYFDETFIAGADGQVLARTTSDGDDLAVAETELAEHTPIPRSTQPRPGLSPLAYWADWFTNAALVSEYRKWQNQ
ncbi:MAG: hypothetical protein DDG60_09380 [Anaerolineae bacterium]|nr:MAG: hypothetical protein DDG60_09380 [Anaerolineae bacterium]